MGRGMLAYAHQIINFWRHFLGTLAMMTNRRLRRDKTRQLFAEALLLAREAVPGADAGAAAAEAESAMHRQNGGVNARYKAKYRSLIFNLKDANNPDLRRRVLSGEITGAPLQKNELIFAYKHVLHKLHAFAPCKS